MGEFKLHPSNLACKERRFNSHLPQVNRDNSQLRPKCLDKTPLNRSVSQRHSIGPLRHPCNHPFGNRLSVGKHDQVRPNQLRLLCNR